MLADGPPQVRYEYYVRDAFASTSYWSRWASCVSSASRVSNPVAQQVGDDYLWATVLDNLCLTLLATQYHLPVLYFTLPYPSTTLPLPLTLTLTCRYTRPRCR